MDGMAVPPIPEPLLMECLRRSDLHPNNVYLYMRAYWHKGGPPDLLGLFCYQTEEEEGVCLWPILDRLVSMEAVAVLRHVTGVYYELVSCHPERVKDD